MLDHFGVKNAKSVSTPLVAHFKLLANFCLHTDEEIKYMPYIPYSSVVGSLMYAIVCTRPDISYLVAW